MEVSLDLFNMNGMRIARPSLRLTAIRPTKSLQLSSVEDHVNPPLRGGRIISFPPQDHGNSPLPLGSERGSIHASFKV